MFFKDISVLQTFPVVHLRCAATKRKHCLPCDFHHVKSAEVCNSFISGFDICSVVTTETNTCFISHEFRINKSASSKVHKKGSRHEAVL